MSEFELSDFEILQEYPAAEHREYFSAVEEKTGRKVLLTVFSPEISQRAEFRRALKTDRAMLMMLQHQSLVRCLGHGETGDQLFLCSEFCDYLSLEQQLQDGRIFSSDDVIEIGWQICSALQQAHNFGLAHGGLSVGNVLLSDNLQVMLSEFGIDRWLRAASQNDSAASGPALITVRAMVSREEVEADLSGLTQILDSLLETVPAPDFPDGTETARSSTRAPLERLLKRVKSSNPSLRPVSAREFQGRLGEILIGSDDDAMPLVDQRQSAGTSRRSIIVELFEPSESFVPQTEQSQEPAGSASLLRILPIVIIVFVILLIALIAGQLL